MNLNAFVPVRRIIHLLAVCLVAIASVLALPSAATAQAADVPMTVYRDPDCRCCGGWMKHLSAEGFEPSNVPTADMEALKQQYGVPADLSSCHTAIVGGYVIEGHVPAADIKRLLVEHPPVAGIAVPGMPIGTAGMESEDVHDPFTVFSFDAAGNATVFNKYAAE